MLHINIYPSQQECIIEYQFACDYLSAIKYKVTSEVVDNGRKWNKSNNLAT